MRRRAHGTHLMSWRLVHRIVVVKRAKPQQDHRFDLPAIGARTIEVIAAVKGATPAVEAGRTVALESAEVARRADAAGVALSSPDE